MAAEEELPADTAAVVHMVDTQRAVVDTVATVDTAAVAAEDPTDSRPTSIPCHQPTQLAYSSERATKSGVTRGHPLPVLDLVMGVTMPCWYAEYQVAAAPALWSPWDDE